ncbi:PAS domain S-box-containing protein [Gelidibacter algens]|jgi:PAS domain S-box-containing protein|uniref:PAS domain S-box-containing protein n=1 Tax=Gelidibacter algens TaxID=49280 RepID=A0A327SFH8_9FLAO|nr:PAS domain-containing protein [Gelidibacter algens]RAJ27786.1 PAS domain S-box-containing protein [Gelidibacter algens]
MTKKLAGMMGLDIYLSSMKEHDMDPADYEMNSNLSLMPLLSWDIYNAHYFSRLQEFQRTQDILKVEALGQKLNWTSNINDLFKNEEFEAILVTDLDQKIIWVNDGFTEMTGYTKTEALRKTPRFLQGPKSSSETKDRIRQKLSGIEPFTEVIINYKKNRDPYKCEVKIFPLYNEETTHFMALERRVV